MAKEKADKDRYPRRGFALSVIALFISVSSLIAGTWTTYVNQRAYVFAMASGAFDVRVAGDPLTVYVQFINSGNTLAHITSRSMGVTIASALPDSFDGFGKTTREPGEFVAWPKQTSAAFRTLRTLTEADIQKLNESQTQIYVFGTIEYRDAFYVNRRTTFCHTYSGAQTANMPPHNQRGYHPSQAQYCDKYNDAE